MDIMNTFSLDEIRSQKQLTIIAGPCVIEDRDMAFSTAQNLLNICQKHDVALIFKASYDKANRSSLHSFRGVGIDKGLSILQQIKTNLKIPVTSDVHSSLEVIPAAAVLDILQIPAFLCRQTDLLVGAAKTGRIINVKKGQFMSPWEMENVIEKIKSSGNNQIIATDRGTCFGYSNLISDMRSIPIIKKYGALVCFDASHSVQLPAKEGSSSGGQKEFIPILANAALAAGTDLLFFEIHPEPLKAKSDKSSQLSLQEFDTLLPKLKKLYAFMNHAT